MKAMIATTPAKPPTKTKTPARKYHHGDLAHASLTEALSLIEERGHDGLTLAELAKRLKVSHVALYRHYADREALIAAVAEESFRSFGAALREAHESPRDDLLHGMVRAYLAFARKHPARYALMFGRSVCAPPTSTLDEAARASFMVLLEALRLRRPGGDASLLAAQAKQVWAVCHGFASLTQIDALGLSATRTTELAWETVRAVVS